MQELQRYLSTAPDDIKTWINNNVSNLEDSARSLIDILNPIGEANGAEINAAADDHFIITNNAGNLANESTDYSLTFDYLTGIIQNGGNWLLTMPANVVNANGVTNVAQAWMLSDGWRPGAGELSTFDFSNLITGGTGSVWDSVRGSLFTDTLHFDSSQFTTLGGYNNYQAGSSSVIY